MFNRALALTRKLGFPDVILPGEAAESSRGWWGQGRVGAQRQNSLEKWKEEKVRGRGIEGAEEGSKRGWRFDRKNRKWEVVRTVTCSYPVNDTTSPPILTALTVPPGRPF